VPTLRALLQQPYRLWLCCDVCGHRVAVALVSFIIRWVSMRRRTCCARMHGARCVDDVGRAFNIRVGVTRKRGGRRFRGRGGGRSMAWADLNDPPKPIDSTRLVQKEYLLRRCRRGVVLTFGE
jgi:hypothetical protein